MIRLFHQKILSELEAIFLKNFNEINIKSNHGKSNHVSS